MRGVKGLSALDKCCFHCCGGTDNDSNSDRLQPSGRHENSFFPGSRQRGPLVYKLLCRF
jgi:hypothetical protein